ncbi:MAG: hypothetical protein R3276_05575 [Marinobacter sp.]|nr:hypothetical protein [Marinobacter sp.]
MIIRALCIVLLMVGLIALAVLGPRWLMKQSSDADSPEATCNVKDEGCQWSNGNTHWQVRVTETGSANGLHQFHLDLQTNAQPGPLHGVLVGESMYLGEYPVILKPGANPGEWAAAFSAPFCTVQDEMVWRIELKSGEKVLEHVPFRLTFATQAR